MNSVQNKCKKTTRKPVKKGPARTWKKGTIAVSSVDKWSDIPYLRKNVR